MINLINDMEYITMINLINIYLMNMEYKTIIILINIYKRYGIYNDNEFEEYEIVKR